jgi:hypothetical protein
MQHEGLLYLWQVLSLVPVLMQMNPNLAFRTYLCISLRSVFILTFHIWLGVSGGPLFRLLHQNVVFLFPHFTW